MYMYPYMCMHMHAYGLEFFHLSINHVRNASRGQTYINLYIYINM